MFNYQSSNSFLRKFFYYLKNILNLFIPNFFYRRKLNKILSRPLDEETISRVNYYFKQNGEIELTANAKNIYEIFFNQLKKNKQNSHFFDFYNLAKFFKTNYKFEYIYNSPNYIGSNIAKRKSLFPIFVKSRPIIDNENSLLLKINQVKLFHFINDKLDFKSKKNVAVWRGDSKNNSKRSFFIEKYIHCEKFDIGQTNGDKNSPLYKDFLPINEQLKNKFIFCLEGKCISTNLFWAMSSNSICVMPKPNYESWFMEGKLKGDYHFIEVDDNFSNAEEKINFYINHPEKCLHMIDNAHKFVNQFKNEKKEQLIQLVILNRYLKLSGQNNE
tara:strand:- start:1495 stop:2481 length:987 start_codon:yes stop_codon:yes gene_type:complete